MSSIGTLKFGKRKLLQCVDDRSSANHYCYTDSLSIQLIMRSTNPREVAYIFRDYIRKIHVKSDPADPNFLRLSIACGKVFSIRYTLFLFSRFLTRGTRLNSGVNSITHRSLYLAQAVEARNSTQQTAGPNS
jgi:farnesyl-diphosphate farnesyltransferase